MVRSSIALALLSTLTACGEGLDDINASELEVVANRKPDVAMHAVNVFIGSAVGTASACPRLKPLEVRVGERDLPQMRRSERFASLPVCLSTVHGEDLEATSDAAIALTGDVSARVSDGSATFSATFSQLCAPRRGIALTAGKIRPGQVVELRIEPPIEGFVASTLFLRQNGAAQVPQGSFSLRDSILSFALPERFFFTAPLVPPGEVAKLRTRFVSDPETPSDSAQIVAKVLSCNGPGSCIGRCIVPVELDEFELEGSR